MNITLDQLKEIAKAGYVGMPYPVTKELTESIDECSIYISKTIYDGTLFRLHKKGCLIPSYILDVVICGISKVYFNTPRAFSFNHLAAIRKMEELGIIEK